MSETDVERLMKKVDDISAIVIRIEQRVSGYEKLEDKVDDIDKRVDLHSAKCKTIQEGKTKINWGTVTGSILIGIIMLIVGYFFAMITK